MWFTNADSGMCEGKHVTREEEGPGCCTAEGGAADVRAPAF